MYKIFHENKTLVFPKIEGDSLKLDATLQESERYETDILCDFFQEWLCDHDPTDTFIHEVSENAVAAALNETFQMAPAAGGVVTKDGKFVSIIRHGIPDLPKGHIERGETPEVAALREVEEETGIGKLHIVKELPSTWHCYQVGDEYKPIYSMNVTVNISDATRAIITADILCLNNTLYHVTTTIGEGINNVEDAVKAIKRIVNGQVVIEKAGKTYNMNGAVVR